MARRRRHSKRRVSRNKRHSKRRHSKRRVSRNRHRRTSMRGLLRNTFGGLLGGADLMRDVAMPVLGGTAGFLAARALGHLAADKIPQLGGNLKYGKALAAVVGIPVAFALSGKIKSLGLAPGAVVLGMGMAPAEAYLRDTPLLGGGAAAAALMPPAAPAATGSYYDSGDGVGSYYDSGMLGQGMDISHAGAPYKGMLGFDDGADPANQQTVDVHMDRVEAISTVTPTDMARVAPNFPQHREVRETMAGAADGRGYAGGIFARQLFSGMMGG